MTLKGRIEGAFKHLPPDHRGEIESGIESAAKPAAAKISVANIAVKKSGKDEDKR
jgi:hypothetical protein